MKWAISLVIALVLNGSSSAFADSILNLVAEPAHTVGPQSSSNPCIIAATTCQQNTNVFDFDNYTQKGSIPSYDEFSPTYTNAQILALFPNLAFNVAIDVNTAQQGEKLDLFEVFINCGVDPSCSGGTRIYHYDAGATIGSLSANGNGYADWTLRTVDLTSLAFTNIKFHAIWSNASDGGESFFLVAGTPNQGCTTNCFPTVPEPSALILMGLGLVLMPAVFRMGLRHKPKSGA